MRSLALCLACVAHSFLSDNARAQSTFTGVGDLPGGIVHSDAAGVSPDGSVVVGTSGSDWPGYAVLECYTWTEAGGIVGHGTLPGGSSYSYGLAVTTSPSLIGIRYGGRAFMPGGNEGFVNATSVGDLPGGLVESTVLGLSDDASKFVGMGNNASSSYEAFVGSPGVLALTPLGGLTGWVQSCARGISGDGAIVVGYSENATNREACRWVAGHPIAMGDLAGGAFYSDAWGASSDGSVIVGESIGMSIDTLAFRWTAATGMVSLGAVTKRANACSADGSVVVGSLRYGASTRAFIWDTVHGLRLLDDVLVNEHGLGAALAGWTLYEATDVSADGRVIVGNGIGGGASQGWRAYLAPDSIQTFCYGDGLGAACPCGNYSALGDHSGCKNTTLLGGKLTGAGTPSVSADTLVLSGSQMPGGSSALYFQGDSSVAFGAGTIFGDGLRCVTTNVVRLGTKFNSAAGVSEYPSGSTAISVRGAVGAGSTKRYQTWYRNAAGYCGGSVFNLTNGVAVSWSF